VTGDRLPLGEPVDVPGPRRRPDARSSRRVGLRRQGAALSAAALVLAVALALTWPGGSGRVRSWQETGGMTATASPARPTSRTSAPVTLAPETRVPTPLPPAAAAPASAGPATLSGVDSVSCPTASDCWAGATAGHDGVILASTDGGVTWVVQDSVPGSSGIGPLDCPSSSHCWAGAGGPAASGKTPLLLSTGDGGASWTAGPVPGRVRELDDISCVNDADCWLVGSPPAAVSSDIVVATTDGGASWVVQNTGSITVSMGAGYGLSCPSVMRCVIVGTGELATNDGGRTWHTRAFPSGEPGSQLNNLACPSGDDCVAESDVTSGVPANQSTAIATSTDGGTTWQIRLDKVAGGVGTLSGLSCPTTRDCVSVGIGFSGDTSSPPGQDFTAWGAVATSSDGGLTWAATTLPEATNLVDVSCAPGSTDCVAVGFRETGTSSAGDVMQTAGVIFRSANDGATWTLVPLPAAGT
jgi:hypothetical protein